MDKNRIDSHDHNENVKALTALLEKTITGEEYFLSLHSRHNMESHGMRGQGVIYRNKIKAMKKTLNLLKGAK